MFTTSRATLMRLVDRLVLLGQVVVLTSAFGLGCSPAVPVASYDGTSYSRRVQPGALKILRASLPDEFYQDIGIIKVACKGEAAESSGALGSVGQGSGGCSFSAALELARQEASAAGAHGMHTIQTTPGANGNIVTFTAKAFRFTSIEPGAGMSSADAPLPSLPPQAMPPPAPVPGMDQQPAQATTDGEPQELPPPPPVPVAPPRPMPPVAVPQRPLPPVTPLPNPYTARPAPVTPQRPMPVATPTPARPMPVATPTPARPAPIATPTPARPMPVATPTPQRPLPVATSGVEKPPLVIVPPPADPSTAPVIPAPPPGSTSAQTLLPAEERLKRLKELRDKGMIPQQIYDRRRKEIMQGN